MKYWAIDYVNSYDDECELVVGDQLYPTEEEAAAALLELPRPDLYEVSWYSFPDLVEIYNESEIIIDEQLRVRYPRTW